MEPIRSSETSAIKTQTPGNYPKRNTLQLLLVFMIVSYNMKILMLLSLFLSSWYSGDTSVSCK